MYYYFILIGHLDSSLSSSFPPVYNILFTVNSGSLYHVKRDHSISPAVVIFLSGF